MARKAQDSRTRSYGESLFEDIRELRYEGCYGVTLADLVIDEIEYVHDQGVELDYDSIY